MKLFLITTLLLSFSISYAEVSHSDVETMLQQMIRENVISAQEAEKVKVRMKAMTPDQWSAINSKASEVASRSPASVTQSNNKIEEVQGIDLDGAQFKAIQNEVKKIVPEYKD